MDVTVMCGAQFNTDHMMLRMKEICECPYKSWTGCKNAWFQMKALEAERRRNNNKGVWKCIRDIYSMGGED